MVFTEALNKISQHTAPKHSSKKQITISLDFDFDQYFKSRLVFLGAILFLSALALLMFARADFMMSDLFDLGRLQYTLEKAYSISAILYVLLFALAIAASTYYGFGLKKLQALFALPVTLLPALIFGFVYPALFVVFFAMAITIASAAFFASFAKEANFTYANSAIDRALMLFVLLAFVFAFLSVNGQKDARFDQFFQGTADLALNQLNSPTVAAAASTMIIPQFNATQIINTAFDRTSVRNYVKSQYDSQRDTVLASFQGQPTYSSMASTYPAFTQLPIAKQEEMVNTVYTLAANRSDALEQGIINIARKVTTNSSSVVPVELSAYQLNQVKQQVMQVPAMKTLYDNFPLFIALLIAFIVASFNFFTKIIASIMTWTLMKLEL